MRSRAKVPAREASSTSSNCPSRSSHRSKSARNASIRSAKRVDGERRCWVSSPASSCCLDSRRSNSNSHFAVLSVAISSSSPKTAAAAAEGASPITEPAPYFSRHTCNSAERVVVFPAPAGPTITSKPRPEVGCVKKCEQSLVFFCVVTLPEGERRLGVYPRPVPGCGIRVQSGVAFGCRTPRHIPLLQTVLVRGCETIGGNTSRSLRKRRNFPQRHYPNTRRYDPWIDEYYYRDNIREIPPTYIDFRGPNEK